MSELSFEESHAIVHNALGEDVASKASPAFCLAYARSTAAPMAPLDAGLKSVGAALETVGGRPPLVHAVIELDPVEPPSPGLGAVVKQMRASGAWDAARKSAVDALGAGADAGLAARTAARLHPTLLMREIYVQEMRERCLLAMSPIRDGLEQDVLKLLGKGNDKGVPGSLTEMCWLNQTIRTWTSPTALSATAAHKSVASIDVPHALQSELRQTGKTVGAVQHRAATQRTGGVIVVAVIDGEVSLTHPALRGRVVHRRNFTDEAWGKPSVHGTAVAGIIAAQGADELVGMAPGAIIYNYKVLPGEHPDAAGDFALACALQQALEDGARIANCSLLSKTPANGQSRLARACNNAWALGMTIVKSAGNGGEKGAGTITCPGDAKGTIVVGATGRNGKSVAVYSSQGPVPGKPFCPDLVAPGGDENDEVFSCTLDGEFGEITPGTSLAAPHVSGLLALILEGRPDLTPDEQRELLLEHCDKEVEGGPENVEGRGRISIARLDRRGSGSRSARRT